MLGRFLFYGDAGAGKSAIGVSAFWDFKARTQLCDGRWLLIGQEDNDALGVPESLIVRFISPAEKPLKFATEFSTYLMAAVAQRAKGPAVFFIDGLSEWNIAFLYEHERQTTQGDKWEKFDDAKDRFYQAVQLLNPHVLKATVIASARVDEKRKGVYNKKTDRVEGEDPGYWRELKYVPSTVGWIRKNVNSYFDLVSYVEAGSGPVQLPDGTVRQAPQHRYYMLPHEGFLTKNRWEHDWIVANKPDYLVNATFGQLVSEIEDAQQKAAAARATVATK